MDETKPLDDRGLIVVRSTTGKVWRSRDRNRQEARRLAVKGPCAGFTGGIRLDIPVTRDSGPAMDLPALGSWIMQ